MSGLTPAHQSELIALSQEAYQLPTRGRTRETQVYVRWQKAGEEQKQFDKAKRLSFLPSRDSFSDRHCIQSAIRWAIWKLPRLEVKQPDDSSTHMSGD